MKKYLLLFLVSILVLPLFGKITIGESVPLEYRNIVEEALVENTKGRRDADIVLDSFVFSDDLVSFSLSIGESTYNTTVPSSYLDEEIGNMLYYSPYLYSTSEMRLDYISDLSYSTSASSLNRGNVLFLEEEGGKDRGVFVSSSKHDDAFELDALYLSSPFPGMKMEKGKGVETTLSQSLSLEKRGMSTEAGVSFYTPLYPLLPYVGLGFDYVGGTVSGFLSLGGRTAFYLSSLWDDVPIVKNISIDGRVEMLIKYRGKVEMGGRWNISGVYRPMSWLSLSLGYTSDADLGNMVSLSLGVLL